MRAEARTRHAEAAISWIDDALPALNQIYRQGHAFHVILLSGVWQHVPPPERARALRKLLGLLRAGGMLALSLRHGADGAARGMHPVSLDEVERLSRAHGAMVERVVDLPNQQGRSGMSWTGVVLRLPDDGTGALPLLRHVILNNAKSATYKLGLLRALCRAADGQAGLAHEPDEDTIVLPLGAIALNWLRLYLPLVGARLPQKPGNAGPDGLGFAGAGFRALLDGLVPRLDLRIGARFAGAQATTVHAALQEAAKLIADMPATYITYPNGGPVLPTVRRRAPRIQGEFVLDAETLSGFGTIALPRTMWRAMGRFAGWVEPAPIAEWMRLMRDYAIRQDRVLDEGAMAAAMTWAEPALDVALSRERALALLGHGEALHCVWSGRKLTAGAFCLPWSAWPCGDLWNLLPVHPEVNRHQKRERLPGAELLRKAAEPIQDWWQRAYLGAPGLQQRFGDEARASLPGLVALETTPPEEVFAALYAQRLRLRHDQQVPEWSQKSF